MIVVEGKSFQWKFLLEHRTEHWVVHFVWKEKWLEICLYTAYGLWPVIWLDSQGLGNTMIRILVTKKFGKCMWIDLSEWARNVKIFVSHVNAHQRGNISTGEL